MSEPTPAELAQEIEDYLALGWVGSRTPPHRMLTQAAQLLRTMPTGPTLWAVATEDYDAVGIFDSEDHARDELVFRNEANEGYVIYKMFEVREVPDAQ